VDKETALHKSTMPAYADAAALHDTPIECVCVWTGVRLNLCSFGLVAWAFTTPAHAYASFHQAWKSLADLPLLVQFGRTCKFS
jgi:hypothetical protein